MELEPPNWIVTHRKLFSGLKDSDPPVVLEVQDDSFRFAWRLCIADKKGRVSTHYTGIYEFEGWGMITGYFDGVLGLEPFVPFRVEMAKEIK